MIFQDLDGCLVDFEKGVLDLTGKSCGHWTKNDYLYSVMWRACTNFEDEDTGRGFFDWCGWMSDGKQLWEHVKHLNPTVLTGIPRGQWATPQKLNWCARELHPDVPVITCQSHLKAKNAMSHLDRSDLEECVLIDDRISAKKLWEDHGGTFIHHVSAAETIRELNEFQDKI